MNLTLRQVQELLSNSHWKNEQNDYRFSNPNLSFNKNNSKYEIIENKEIVDGIECNFHIILLDINRKKISIINIDTTSIINQLTLFDKQRIVLQNTRPVSL